MLVMTAWSVYFYTYVFISKENSEWKFIQKPRFLLVLHLIMNNMLTGMAHILDLYTLQYMDCQQPHKQIYILKAM